MSTARFDASAEQSNVYMAAHRVTERESLAFRRQIAIDALDVHEREGCPRCPLAIKLWEVLSLIDGENYVKQLMEEANE